RRRASVRPRSARAQILGGGPSPEWPSGARPSGGAGGHARARMPPLSRRTQEGKKHTDTMNRRLPGKYAELWEVGGKTKTPKIWGNMGHIFICVYLFVCVLGPLHARGRASRAPRCAPAQGRPLRGGQEVSMLPQEQMFWGGQPVNRMLFVRVGSVFYKDDHTDIETLQVKVGEWACEETLWSKVSLLSRPLTASTLGCELITILPSEFQMLTRIHPPALRFCVSYASVFIKSFNCASKDPNYRNLLFNDFQETSNMVMEACTGLDDHLSNKQGTRYQVSQSKKNLLRVGRSRRGSRES
ncbi:unnamed protein product, partial [Prorocentrum cordatum]